jgi:DNA invertase Pin-like site-specific DNA recombinase
MPQPHPFAAAPALKGRVRAVPKPRVTVYGYARVSIGGQSVDAQARQLRAASAGKVFRETASGAKADRAQLRRVLAELGPRDVLTVTRLDRLARSTRDLLTTLAAITDKKAGFRSLADAWADTTTAHGRLMLTVLGGLSEFERELIRVRTGEGRARAKANGQSLGRRPKLTPRQKQEAIRRRDEGETLGSNRPQLQCQPKHDFKADGVTHSATACQV